MVRISKDRHLRPEHKALTQMVYKDLKIACIVRGMEFQDIVEGDHGLLASYFIKHFYDDQDAELLEDFDIWMDRQLEKNGLSKDDPLREYKLSSTIDPDTHDIKLRRRKIGKSIKLSKKKKKKRERNDTFNVIKGTKKEYTMELAKKLFDLNKNVESKKLQSKLVERVRQQYPDANEKSILIWFKRAINELNKKKETE